LIFDDNSVKIIFQNVDEHTLVDNFDGIKNGETDLTTKRNGGENDQ
jgi:hypothetical protein